MTLPETSLRLEQTLTLDEALETLKALLRGDVDFNASVVRQIDDLLRSQPDRRVSREVLQGLLDLNSVFFLHLSLRQGIPVILKAIRCAKRLNDQTLLVLALVGRASIAAETGDLSTAIEAGLEALKVAHEIRDVNRIGLCYLNLGVYLREAGRFESALACTKESIRWFQEPGGNAERVGWAFNAVADQCLKNGDWRAALEAATHARQTLDEMTFREELKAISRAVYSYVLMNEVTALVHLGEFETARNTIDEFTLVVKRYPSERTEACFRFARAVYAGFVGDSEEAVQTLRKFRDLPEMRNEALQYLTTIYERRGEPEKALEITRELLEGLRAARREITSTDLAQLDVCSPSDDDDVIKGLISRAAGFEQVVERIGDKFEAKLAYLFELAVSAELREEGGEYVGEHIYRVGRLCAALASEAGCGEEMCWLAEVAGRAHDVGKTSVPSLTILKTEPLNNGEKELLWSHAEDGAALVAQLTEPRLVQVVAAVRHHHERWDGAGYPSKLKGEEIPLLARIVAICDSFDAMTHARAFRSARSVAGGLVEVERCAGSQFDPRLGGLFVNLVRRLQREQGDLDEYLGELGRRTRWAKSHPELMRLLETSGQRDQESFDSA